MSSDDDADIDRLRSDLIRSIRSKKSSRVNSSSGTSSPTVLTADAGSNASTSFAATILDTDMDDLEALRRAALGTLKRSKGDTSNKAGSCSPHGSQRFADGMPLPHHNSGALYPQASVYPPPPILLGPTASFSQFPAPPPAYKPRFFNHHAAGFRPMLRMARSNLIVIQTAPPPEIRYEQAVPSAKLMLPQDRYSRYDSDGQGDKTKRKRDDKWSRYDDTSSSTSSSSKSPTSFDFESEEESDTEVVCNRSSNGDESVEAFSEKSGTLGEPPGAPGTSTRDATECVDDAEWSSDSVTSEPKTGVEFQNGITQVQPTTSAQSTMKPRHRSLEEEILLEEPVHAIEFLDEPVDEDIVHRLAAASTPVIESSSTPEQVQVQAKDDQSLDAPLSKELKKQKLKSELQAVKQQLEQLYRHKKAAASSRRYHDAVDEEDADASKRLKRGLNTRGHEEGARSEEERQEPAAKYAKRENVETIRRPGSGNKQLLSSVVVVVSRSGRVCEEKCE